RFHRAQFGQAERSSGRTPRLTSQSCRPGGKIWWWVSINVALFAGGSPAWDGPADTVAAVAEAAAICRKERRENRDMTALLSETARLRPDCKGIDDGGGDRSAGRRCRPGRIRQIGLEGYSTSRSVFSIMASLDSIVASVA